MPKTHRITKPVRGNSMKGRVAVEIGLALVCALFPTVIRAQNAAPQLTPAELRDDQFAVAYQQNAAHSGSIIFDKGFAPPFVTLWEVDFGVGPSNFAFTSNPLIAAGEVFVTVNRFTGVSDLYALDEANGNVVWHVAIPDDNSRSSITYDSGIVFDIASHGHLQAFDAQTGSLLWAADVPGGVATDPPPTAANGTVYVEAFQFSGELGQLWAYEGATGNLLWTQNLTAGGGGSMPTASDQGVFITQACNYFKFDPGTGTPTGQIDQGPCDKIFGAQISVYYRGRLYTRDAPFLQPSKGQVVDTNENVVVGGFTEVQAPPAFQGKIGYFVDGSNVVAREKDSSAVLWSFAATGGIQVPVLVVNDVVLALSNSGQLTALDRGTGAVLQSVVLDSVPVSAGPQPAGMGAGDGLLVVPVGSHLIAIAPRDRFRFSR